MNTTTSILLLFGAAFVAAVGGICWSLGQRKRRTARLSEIALRLGFSLDPKGASLLNEPAGKLPVFVMAQAGSGEILNVMRGQVGGSDAVVCDYQYWSGTGDNRSDYSQTVFCFKIAKSSDSDFSLRPKMSPLEEEIVSMAASFWGLDTTTSGDSGSRYAVQKAGEWMAIWQRNMTVKPEDLATTLNDLFSMCSSFRDQHRILGNPHEGS